VGLVFDYSDLCLKCDLGLRFRNISENLFGFVIYGVLMEKLDNLLELDNRIYIRCLRRVVKSSVSDYLASFLQ
jgi:hypothetical protein